MPNFEYTLEKLSMTFTARDIMRPMADLVCGSNEAEAKNLLTGYPGYDVITIKQNGALTAYIERGRERAEIIRPQHIISDATSILDLVEIFRHRKFLFVLVKDVVEGYIHNSDLNNRIVKIPYFVILEAFERFLLERLNDSVNQNTLERELDHEQYRSLEKRMERMQENRTDLNWGDLLTFRQILEFSCRFEKVKLKPKQIDMLCGIRNDVAHAGRMLVQQHLDVQHLVEVKNICIQTIQDQTC